MPADLQVIREGLAEALQAVQLVEDMQVSPYLPDDPYPPCAWIVPDETEYHQAMQDGAETWGLAVQVMVALGHARGAQLRLDRMLASSGPQSVKQALEAATDPGGPLNGIVANDGVTVVRTSGYRTYTLPTTQAEALGAEWTVEVLV